MKNNKKNRKETLNDEILEFSEAQPPLAVPKDFVTPFPIFGASQSEFSIKSYGRLKFFHSKIVETLNLWYKHPQKAFQAYKDKKTYLL